MAQHNRVRRTDNAPTRGEPPGDPEQDLGDPEAVARAICLRLLTQRARSRAELAAALARRGVPDDAAGRVLDRFAEVGLIDDAALATGVAQRQHRERGLGRRAVAASLHRRGLGEHVDAALGDITGADERERARELVAKRRRALSGLPADVQARRLVGLLARKGYSAGLAYGVVREALAGAGGWEAPDADDGGAADAADGVAAGDVANDALG